MLYLVDLVAKLSWNSSTGIPRVVQQSYFPRCPVFPSSWLSLGSPSVNCCSFGRPSSFRLPFERPAHLSGGHTSAGLNRGLRRHRRPNLESHPSLPLATQSEATRVVLQSQIPFYTPPTTAHTTSTASVLLLIPLAAIVELAYPSQHGLDIRDETIA